MAAAERVGGGFAARAHHIAIQSATHAMSGSLKSLSRMKPLQLFRE
jgi:hypothetical protein